ncbi:copper transporter 1 [Artemisia annua]|uniref:Copper transport protein n=1 Tax=Artemisia annua TaxID=35608 RepID=A0A2U1M357_ARTAN|nr:copper transporter 1 [Artemisia annua]
MSTPPMMNGGNVPMGMPHRKKMMMHMTFYWGKDALILFTGWPGNNDDMYMLALLLVFFMAVIGELLSYCNRVMMKSNGATSGLAQTFVYTIRVGLGFMVMLALMSFNVGVFLAAVLGHAVGFFCFQVVMKKKDDLMSTTPC